MALATRQDVRKEVRYINKDFSSLRKSLINYAKTYFPSTYNDFNESSPGMMFIEISERRRMALAMRWIISFSTARKGQTMADRLAAEFLAAANNEGPSVKKKEDTHRMAEANKAFSHFR